MNNGLIVLFDVLIIANLFTFAVLLCGDLTRMWRVVVGVLMLASCAALLILTIGDLVIWLDSVGDDRWFMDRGWRAGWRAPLGVTLTAVNIATLSIHHRGPRV